MKSKKKDAPKNVSKPFPKLMISDNGGASEIILATEEIEEPISNRVVTVRLVGTVVWRNEGSIYELGRYSNSWVGACFRDYDGEVKLES